MPSRRLQTILPIITGSNPVSKLRGKLSHGAVSQICSLQYVDATTCYVWTPIDGTIYFCRWELSLLASGAWTRSNLKVFRVMDAINRDDGGITESGSWSAPGSTANALGRDYRSDKNVAAYAEFTVTGVERVYITYERRSICGHMKVLVDGAPGNCSDLTLVGADMCLDCYGAVTAVNLWGCVAQDLDPASSYTIRIAPQGTTSGGSDTYMYREGYGVPVSAFSDANETVSNDNEEVAHIETGDNGYAYQYRPTGAAGYEFTGSDHQNEAIAAVTWKDGAGADISVSVGTPLNDAAEVVVNQTGTARHSETGATDHAAIDTTLLFSYQGCRQDVEHTWSTDALLLNAYVGMSVGRSNMERGHIADGSTTVNTLTADDDSLAGEIASRLALFWDTTHDFVLQDYIIDPASVNHWQESTNFCYIEDKAAGNNKIYFQRLASGSLLATEVWSASYLYAVSLYPSFSP